MKKNIILILLFWLITTQVQSSTITEAENYDTNIYQIDTTDLLVGGPNGILNKATQSLANRTNWLKAQVMTLTAGVPGTQSEKLDARTIPGDIFTFHPRWWENQTLAEWLVAHPKWKIADGTNGTDDYRNIFPIGGDGFDVTGLATTSITGVDTHSGGSKDSVVVAHTHTATQQAHNHSVNYAGGVGSVDGGGLGSYNINYPSGTNEITSSAAPAITINSTGESGTDKNLPPYRVFGVIVQKVSP